MFRRAAIAMLIGAMVLGCGPQGPIVPSIDLPSPSAPAGGAIRLNPAPADLGCDAVPAQYNSVTFRIDVAAADQVTATTDTGKTLRTFWAAGFQGGAADDPVVRDQLGAVIAADGDVLEIPSGAWPRLHGYFVCPSTDALYVLVDDAGA